MKFSTLTAVAAAVALCTACSCRQAPAEGPADISAKAKTFTTEIEDGKAHIYVYRDNSSDVNSGEQVKSLFIDENCIGELSTGNFMFFDVNTGADGTTYRIYTESENIPTQPRLGWNYVNVYAENGKAYYVKQTVTKGIYDSKADLVLLTDDSEIDAAKEQIAKETMALFGKCPNPKRLDLIVH